MSLDAQRDRIRAYCRLHTIKLIDIKADEGISGGTLNQTGLQAALECSAGLPEHLFARFGCRQMKGAQSVGEWQMDAQEGHNHASALRRLRGSGLLLSRKDDSRRRGIAGFA